MSIKTGDQFVDLRSNTLVEVIKRLDTDHFLVITLEKDGTLGKPRKLSEGSLHTSFLNSRGVPRKTGYVKAAVIPQGHPSAPAPRSTMDQTAPSFLDADPDFDELPTSVLADYIARVEAQAALASDLAKEAKKEMQSRTGSAGTAVYGGIAVVAKGNKRFSAELARKLLTAEQYLSICVPSPNADRAKVMLDEALYQKVCKDHGWALTVRPATDADRAAVEEAESIAAVLEISA